MGVNVYTYFGQKLILSMGYSLNVALIMILPTTIVAVIIGYGLSVLSDRWHLRSPFFAFNCLLTIIGAATVGFSTVQGARFMGLFFLVTG